MWDALPQNVLVHVLQHVDQSERLGSAALVNSTWATAAVMATDAILLSKAADDEDTWQPVIEGKLLPWLQHHGQYVTSLSCRDSWSVFGLYIIRTLPGTSNLQELCLDNCAMQLAPTDQHPGILQAATGLTAVDFSMADADDFIPDGLGSLTALHALPALQSFSLSVREEQGLDDDYDPGDQDVLPSSVLCGLTGLTRLFLYGVLALESLQPFSCLSSLQQLHLQPYIPLVDAAGAVEQGQQPFRQLHALTRLELAIPECTLVSTNARPAFAGCTALQSLSLAIGVHASAFQGLTGLTSLCVKVPAVIEGGAAGVAAALAHISRMPHLELLVLECRDDSRAPVALHGHTAQLCGVVTGCAGLERLNLSGLVLPPAAWSDLFPPGRQLLQLHSLHVKWDDAWWDVKGARLDGDELRHLVRCCPGLTSLGSDVLSAFRPGLCLEPLLELRQLESLDCTSVDDGPGSMGVLTRMRWLKRLTVVAGSSLSDAGLLQLTVLTGLEHLMVKRGPQSVLSLPWTSSGWYGQASMTFTVRWAYFHQIISLVYHCGVA